MAFRDALERLSDEQQLARLRELSSDECDALFDLLMTGALVDGEMSQDEANALAEEFLHLPFYCIAHKAEVVREHGFMRRGVLLEKIATEGVEPILDSVAARLRSPEHREAALRALAVVLEADGVAPDELNYAMQASDAFGISGADALEILRDVWNASSPPFAG